MNGTRQTSAHTRSHFLFPVYHNVRGLVTARWLFADAFLPRQPLFSSCISAIVIDTNLVTQSPEALPPRWTVDFLQLMSPGLIWFNRFDWIKHHQRQTIFLIIDPVCSLSARRGHLSWSIRLKIVKLKGERLKLLLVQRLIVIDTLCNYIYWRIFVNKYIYAAMISNLLTASIQCSIHAENSNRHCSAMLGIDRRLRLASVIFGIRRLIPIRAELV